MAFLMISFAFSMSGVKSSFSFVSSSVGSMRGLVFVWAYHGWMRLLAMISAMEAKEAAIWMGMLAWFCAMSFDR